MFERRERLGIEVSGKMVAQIFNAIRGYLGAFALVLGCLGAFLSICGLPLAIFGAHFWGGFGFHEGPQPTREQLDAAISHEFWWSMWHRIVPLFVGSIMLIGYGWYEAYRERSGKNPG